MDFTREPIIETIITPKEGFKLVVRSSKAAGHEEYFVDAVEVVSFGRSFFYRSLERPKSFLLPITDYEVLEVREARMVLKNVGVDRSIKIGGGRETSRPAREASSEKAEEPEAVPSLTGEAAPAEGKGEKFERKRDRRRNSRRRRGRDEGAPASEEAATEQEKAEEEGAQSLETPSISPEKPQIPVPPMTGLLPPPPTLISETIARYKDNAMFKGAFFTKEEAKEETLLEEREAFEQPAEEQIQEIEEDIDFPPFKNIENLEEEEGPFEENKGKYDPFFDT